MKATIMYVSESKKSALVSVEALIEGTPLKNKVSGWMPITGKAAKGDSFELPFTTVYQATSSVTDEESGEVNTFTWLSFS